MSKTKDRYDCWLKYKYQIVGYCLDKISELAKERLNANRIEREKIIQAEIDTIKSILTFITSIDE